MYQFNCPYCGHILVDDGTLAGQLVMCPQCHGQIQMPGNPAVVASQPPPISPQPTFSVSPSTSYKKKSRNEAHPVVLWGTILFVVVVAVAAIVSISNEMSSGSTKASDYENGYAFGHQHGEIDRNFGNSFSPSSEFSDFVAETRWGYLKDKKVPLPETGTREYGDFREGFYAGYQDGYAGK
jgi:hypothetical protein